MGGPNFKSYTDDAATGKCSCHSDIDIVSTVELVLGSEEPGLMFVSADTVVDASVECGPADVLKNVAVLNEGIK